MFLSHLAKGGMAVTAAGITPQSWENEADRNSKHFLKSQYSFLLFQKYSIQVLSLWNQGTLTGLHSAPHSLFLTGQVNSTVSNLCKSHCSSNLLLPDEETSPQSPVSPVVSRWAYGPHHSDQPSCTVVITVGSLQADLRQRWLMTPPPHGCGMNQIPHQEAVEIEVDYESGAWVLVKGLSLASEELLQKSLQSSLMSSSLKCVPRNFNITDSPLLPLSLTELLFIVK